MCLFTPIATDIHIRYGNPVEVGPQSDDPSDEQVNEVFEKYVAELQSLFAAHASTCLPPEVAAMHDPFKSYLGPYMEAIEAEKAERLTLSK